MKKFNKQPSNFSSKVRIAKFILEMGETSKPEIAQMLGISMPTILQGTKELMDDGIIHEIGEYESTGGRKAKILSVVEDNKYAVGLEITGHHISFVTINLKSEIIKSERHRITFSNSEDYYLSITRNLNKFISASKVPKKDILGVGVSIPGIVSKKENTLLKSHVLNVNNLNLNILKQYIDYDVHFENDANAAAMAELKYLHNNAIYLSLSNTVGGSIYFNNEIYYGDHYQSAEFGHMIIEPNGKLCYCGKRGCMDTYCSAKVLEQYANNDLELFFQKLSAKDLGALQLWEDYLEHLAITISNLRLSFDCDVILGGYVGSYLEPYLPDLWRHVQKYSLFETTGDYIKTCRFKREASAVGISMHFIELYFENLK